MVSPILGFQLNSFSEYIRFNSFIFARYYLDYDSDFTSDFRLVFTRIKLCRFYALTLQLFISLTVLRVINKHLCLCEFVLCLFLAILRLSDVFLSVLGEFIVLAGNNASEGLILAYS